jgi:hypothetical protein
MNIIITAQVTYEISDVKDFEEAKNIFQTCVLAESYRMEGVEYIGTKEMFGTEMTEEGTFMEHPQIWEEEEVA